MSLAALQGQMVMYIAGHRQRRDIYAGRHQLQRSIPAIRMGRLKRGLFIGMGIGEGGGLIIRAFTKESILPPFRTVSFISEQLLSGQEVDGSPPTQKRDWDAWRYSSREGFFFITLMVTALKGASQPGSRFCVDSLTGTAALKARKQGRSNIVFIANMLEAGGQDSNCLRGYKIDFSRA